MPGHAHLSTLAGAPALRALVLEHSTERALGPSTKDGTEGVNLNMGHMHSQGETDSDTERWKYSVVTERHRLFSLPHCAVHITAAIRRAPALHPLSKSRRVCGGHLKESHSPACRSWERWAVYKLKILHIP